MSALTFSVGTDKKMLQGMAFPLLDIFGQLFLIFVRDKGMTILKFKKVLKFRSKITIIIIIRLLYLYFLKLCDNCVSLI